jgi:succinate-semialdehyde dehydrogenase/glutarate-semialdehyde dehydrogenase
MTARRNEFARIITLENGKARADAVADAIYAAEFFCWFSEQAKAIGRAVDRAPASGARILDQGSS